MKGDIPMTVRISPKIKEALREKSKREYRTLGATVRKILTEAIKDEKNTAK